MNGILEIFETAGVNQTKMFLVLFSLTLGLQIVLNFREQYRFFQTKPHLIYGNPPPLLGKFQLPSLTGIQFLLFGIGLLISLFCAAAGFFPRVFLLVSIICYFPYFNSIMFLSYVQRKTNLIPIVLLILLFSPGISDSLFQSFPIWPIILVKIAIAQMYFSSGLQKLRNSGIRWTDGKSLQAYLMENYLWSDNENARRLAESLTVCKILSICTLAFELSFWIIILIPDLTYFYVGGAIAFHIGSFYCLRINYLKYLSPVYMVFLIEFAFYLLNAINKSQAVVIN